MKLWKRILSNSLAFFTCAMTCLGTGISSVNAEGPEDPENIVNVSNFMDLKSNLESGNHVRLDESIDCTETITIDNKTNVILDLNGKTLKYTNGIGSVFELENGTNFTLNDSENNQGIITGGRGKQNVVFGELTFESAGGAFYVSRDCRLVIRGGTISENQANAGGGIFVNSGGSLEIFGGIIKKNTAKNTSQDPDPDVQNNAHEGGGIFSDGNLTIRPDNSDIEITDNSTETNSDLGGGGIYINNKSQASIYNAVITDNTATGLGGGVASCLHGTIYDLSVQTAAIYSNKALGEVELAAQTNENGKEIPSTRITRKPILQGKSSEDSNHRVPSIVDHDLGRLQWNEDLVTSAQDVFGAGLTTIGPLTLNGGTADWSGYFQGGLLANNEWLKPEIDGFPGQGSIASYKDGAKVDYYEDPIVVNGLLGLKAYGTDVEGQINSFSENGNKIVNIARNTSSVHGGGIGCNGTLSFGEENYSVSNNNLVFNANKNVIGDVDGSSKAGFKFALSKKLDNEQEVILSTALSDSNGDIKFSPINSTIVFGTTDHSDGSSFEEELILREINEDNPLYMFDDNIYKIRLTAHRNTKTVSLRPGNPEATKPGSSEGYVHMTIFEDYIETVKIIDSKTNEVYPNINPSWNQSDDGTWTINVNPGNPTFINWKTGNLKLTKAIEGLEGDELNKDHTFGFNIQAKSKDLIDKVAGKKFGTVAVDSQGNEIAYGTVTFDPQGAAIAVMTVEAGQTGPIEMEIRYLPVGEYKISEIGGDIPDWTHSVTVSVNGSEGQPSKPVEEPKANLTIQKQIEGGPAVSTEESKFTVVGTSKYGQSVKEEVTVIGNGRTTIVLPKGDYTVTEVSAGVPDGYAWRSVTFEPSDEFGGGKVNLTEDAVITAINSYDLKNLENRTENLSDVSELEIKSESNFESVNPGSEETENTDTAQETVVQYSYSADSENLDDESESAVTNQETGEVSYAALNDAPGNREPGNLTIQKEVRGLSSEIDSTLHPFPFAFQITPIQDDVRNTITANEKGYDVKNVNNEVVGTAKFKDNGQAIVEMTITGNQNESLTIVGLPAGDYQVIETISADNKVPNHVVSVTTNGKPGETGIVSVNNDDPDLGRVVFRNEYSPEDVIGSSTDVTGEVEVKPSDPVTVGFVNKYTYDKEDEKALLTIAKNFEGGPAYSTNKYYFLIEGTTDEGEKFSQFAMVTGNTQTTISLPKGVYTITEIEPNADVEEGYVWTKVTYDAPYDENQEVNLTGEAEVNVTFTATNHYVENTGGLKIVKKVTGNASSSETDKKKFYFSIIGPADLNGEYSGVKFENGKASVTITGAGMISIDNLPAGKYEVTEDTANAQIGSYTLSVDYWDSYTGNNPNSNDGIVEIGNAGDGSVVVVTNNYRKPGEPDKPVCPPNGPSCPPSGPSCPPSGNPCPPNGPSSGGTNTPSGGNTTTPGGNTTGGSSNTTTNTTTNNTTNNNTTNNTTTNNTTTNNGKSPGTSRNVNVPLFTGLMTVAALGAGAAFVGMKKSKKSRKK